MIHGTYEFNRIKITDVRLCNMTFNLKNQTKTAETWDMNDRESNSQFVTYKLRRETNKKSNRQKLKLRNKINDTFNRQL